MKKVICFVAIALFAAAQAIDDEQKSNLKSFYEACVADTGVDNDLILKGRKGEFSNDKKLSEYYFCMFKKIGILNDAGEVQTEVVRQKAPSEAKKENVEKLIAACKDKKGADKYETAGLIYQCYYTNSPEHISFA